MNIRRFKKEDWLNGVTVFKGAVLIIGIHMIYRDRANQRESRGGGVIDSISVTWYKGPDWITGNFKGTIESKAIPWFKGGYCFIGSQIKKAN